jgi:riboflavin biosynthesis pyrimidine reductase
MAGFWPVANDGFSGLMNSIPKLIFTRKGLDANDALITPRAVEEARANLSGDAIPNENVIRSWTHPRVAKGDLREQITQLKREDGKDIVAYGGASLAQSLIELDVVDDYRFLIHPVILGSGLPVFTKAKGMMGLELVDERRFPKGAVAHVYNRNRG